jgi:spore coat protein U-like protein
MVSATVQANCVVRSRKELDFGTYDLKNMRGKPLLHRDGVLSIACTKGAAGVRISLNDGRHALKGRRRMREAHGKGEVDYQIYTSARRNEVWNDRHTVSYFPKTDRLVAISMYGKVPGGQKPRAGEYSDELTATVNF